MNKDYVKILIECGKTYLGIELGSTRIKGVLISPDYKIISSGEFDWENLYKDGYWTYNINDVWTGIQAVFAKISQNIKNDYNITLKKIASIGFSGMMHGYLVLDKNNNLLTNFRTWRNTNTVKAATELTELFKFNIPQRWSIAHLYEAILNNEKHVKNIDYFTTLAGYVHYILTGEKVLGIGEASGMFPVDSDINDYDQTMLDKFDNLTENMPWKLKNILPKTLCAGENAGLLTEYGAKLIDPSGNLEAGIPLCPPEGDASTGMVATNTVATKTCNISAGTSVFAIIVLEHCLKHVYPEIDLGTTPSGKPVAMIHGNNCTNEINAWANVFKEFLIAIGQPADMNEIFNVMFNEGLKGENSDIVMYNYLSGEPMAGLTNGKPLLLRSTESKLTFSNFMRVHLYSAVATLKLGFDILKDEDITIDRFLCHGGYFKTPVIGQKILAALTNTSVSVMDTAGEGGAWGMAILAAYLLEKSNTKTFEDYLNDNVFKNQTFTTVKPNSVDVEDFNHFMQNYISCLEIEKAAVKCFN